MIENIAGLLAQDKYALSSRLGKFPSDCVVLSIDLESLGTKPGCIILSIGASAHIPDIATPITFHVNIDIEEQKKRGLVEDPATRAWWAMQSAEAWAAATDNAVHPDAAYLRFTDFLRSVEDISETPRSKWHFVGNGPSFDMSLLDAFIATCPGSKGQWPFWRERCLRTVADLSGVYPDRSQGTHHNASVDAVNQGNAYVAGVKLLENQLAVCETLLSSIPTRLFSYWSETEALALLQLIGLPYDRAELAWARVMRGHSDISIAELVHDAMDENA